MPSAAYSTTGGTDWTDFVQDLGYPQELVTYIQQRGFGASITVVDGRHILAFEGSNELKDWGTNIPNGIRGLFEDLGFPTTGLPATEQYAQYWFAAELAQAAKLIYPDLVLTGHSLGGGMAAYAGAKNSIPTVTFNPAGFTSSALAGLNTSVVLNLQIEGDLAQTFLGKRTGQLLGNVVVFDRTALEPAYRQYVDSFSGNGTLAVTNSGVIEDESLWMHSVSRFSEIEVDYRAGNAVPLEARQGIVST